MYSLTTDVAYLEVTVNLSSGLFQYYNGTSYTALESNGTYTISIVRTPTSYLYQTFMVTGFGVGTVTPISAGEVIPTWKSTDVNGVQLTTSLSNADSGTNKCQCVKANPVDTTGLTLSGDAAATLTVVDDSVALAAAGLDRVCTSGMVYKLDNSGGAGNAYSDITGATGNTEQHSLSVRSRAGAGTYDLILSDNSTGGVSATSSIYEYLLSEGVTPPTGGFGLRVRARVGATVYFILPQLEESPVATPVIIGDDTAATASRAADQNVIPTPSVLTPESGAIEIYLVPSETGRDDVAINFASAFYNALVVRPTSVRLYKDPAGAEYASFSYTHAKDVGIKIQAYWNPEEIGVRASDGDITLETFAVNTNVNGMLLDAVTQIGHRDGANVFVGDYSDFIAYASAEAAGWL
jgi:hypothetical protein